MSTHYFFITFSWCKVSDLANENINWVPIIKKRKKKHYKISSVVQTV